MMVEKSPLIEKQRRYVFVGVLFAVVIICIIIVVAITVGDDSSDSTASSVETPKSNEYYEELFVTIPSNESCHAYSEEFASKPHVAGMAQTRVLCSMFGE